MYENDDQTKAQAETDTRATREKLDAIMSQPDCAIVAEGLGFADGYPSNSLLFAADAILTTAPDILAQAKAEQENRAKFYDAPSGERSMAKTVAAFNAMYGTALTEVQGWQFMVLLKMVRASQGSARTDNHVDQTSYSALAGEAALHK